MDSSSNLNGKQSKEEAGIESSGVPSETLEELEKCAISATTPERPKWLPKNWEMEVRPRRSGKTIGLKDRYYYDPKSQRRFRSKKEVENFLRIGTFVRRQSPRTKPPSTDNKPKQDAPSFDFKNCPAKVSWVLNSASEKTWTPYVNDEEVPKSTWNAWAVAFENIISGAHKF